MSDSEKNNKGLSADKAKDSSPKKAHRPVKKPNLSPQRVQTWWREMRSELKKVVWPTPKQVVNNTIIVAVAVVVIGALISVYDLGAGQMVSAIISAFK
ncbi:MAG: preprotein translocase subunit SecE [Oscillospiraceae bacterium]|nr:preprotein translocase subunit SecE [Oscillospiraceae bacterium]